MTTNKPTPLYGPHGTIVYNADGSKARPESTQPQAGAQPMTENSKPEVVAYLAPAGEASMNNVDHVITEAEFARKLDVGGIIQDTVQGAYSVPLVRLFDYESLQADRDQLIDALKRIISSHKINTGAEPSISVFHRDIDEARHLLSEIEGRKP